MYRSLWENDRRRYAAVETAKLPLGGVEYRTPCSPHYPPYCSKYNPIERRLFPHVTPACQRVLFDSVATVKRLLEKTSTATGLGVVVNILDKVYQTGRVYTEGFKETIKILFDDILPRWNYRAIPSRP
jgi:hypothetical protein